MRVISRKTLKCFWERLDCSDAEQPLKAWYKEAEKAVWKNPHDIKNNYATASLLGNRRVVFNIGGNKYRLVVALRYDLGIVYIRFVGNHKEYDSIDGERV